jgi:xanthomonalisin
MTVLACLAPAQAQTQAETRFGSAAADASLQTTPPWPAGQTQPAVLNGNATLIRHYEPKKTLRLAIALALPHPDEEDQFLEEIQDKNSPLFRQFLTSEEWDARFAPTPEAEQAVVDWAASQGLTVTKRYPGRLVVDVEAPAGVVEKALQVTINTYLLPATGRAKARTVYANDRDPVLPADVRQYVHSIHGLNSIVVFHPVSGSAEVTAPDYVPGPVVQELESKAADARGPAAGAGIDAASEAAAGNDEGAETAGVSKPNSGFFSPEDLFSSYAYDYTALMRQGHCCNPLNHPQHSPRESSIAIAAYGNVNLNDVAAFGSAFPYLAYNVQKFGVDGGYTCNDAPKKPDDECIETTLDTEWAIATSNSENLYTNTAKVYVYQGPAAFPNVIIDVTNQIMSDDNARVLSTSWGGEDDAGVNSSSAIEAMHHVYSKMAGLGWTLVAASGDQGATAGCGDQLAVQYPSSDPWFVGVGGTQLNEGNSVTDYEVAWTGLTKKGSCAANNGGGTGGFSAQFQTPPYQRPLDLYARAVPDIALDSADGHDVYYHGGWLYVGGTSVAAPMMAGFFAQADAYLLAIGNKCGAKGKTACAPIGVANYAMYSEGINFNAGRSPFYDIVSGCNSNDITNLYNLEPYCAGPGYDEVTGWGSANMLQLAWVINFYQATAKGAPYVSWNGPVVNRWYNTNQTVSWKIVDFLGSDGGTPTGIAGFTQGWDSIPYDSYSEPSGGAGDSFYSGPEYVNAANGCLAFNANGCAGGVSQGCHSVWVEGWNNMGLSTGQVSYGPLCYDTVAPVTTILLAGTLAAGIYTTSVSAYLTATDATSGVKATYYSVDGSAYSTYSGGFVVSTSGNHTVAFYSVDEAGNKEVPKSTSFTVQIQSSTEPPTATPVLGSPNGTYLNVLYLKISDATPNAVIYYTTNGTTPTTNSTVYSGPVSLVPGDFSTTYTVEAMAVTPGDTPSPIAVGVYTVQEEIQ